MYRRSRARPFEDSGGVWGWAETIEAVNGPKHPEHEELRNWMGLEPGELVDPKAFDKQNVNAVFDMFR